MFDEKFYQELIDYAFENNPLIYKSILTRAVNRISASSSGGNVSCEARRPDIDLTKYIKAYHICEHCNKEYPIDFEINRNDLLGINFKDCPLCGQRNDLWLQIKINEESVH